MPLPLDADSRVSEELSSFITSVVEDRDIEVVPTLGFIRDRLLEADMTEGTEPRRIGSEESLIAEIEALIEEFGEEAPAMDFVVVKASDELSQVIEALLDLSDADIVPSLGGIRAAIADGWVARLAGVGIIDSDEDQTLLAEIDTLIDRYGEDTPAESVLRFQ